MEAAPVLLPWRDVTEGKNQLLSLESGKCRHIQSHDAQRVYGSTEK
jgi:hypothetical protein